MGDQYNAAAIFAGLAAPVPLNTPHGAELVADPTPNIETRLIKRQRAVALRSFVLSLPDRERCIIYALFWMDMTQAEVARRFGVSRAAINKVLKKICKRGSAALSDHTDFACAA